MAFWKLRKSAECLFARVFFFTNFQTRSIRFRLGEYVDQSDVEELGHFDFGDVSDGGDASATVAVVCHTDDIVLCESELGHGFLPIRGMCG